MISSRHQRSAEGRNRENWGVPAIAPPLILADSHDGAQKCFLAILMARFTTIGFLVFAPKQVALDRQRRMRNAVRF